MRLYPKRLRSIDDLRREKKQLQKLVRKLEDEEIFSFDGLMDGVKSSRKKKDDSESPISSLLGLLPVNNPIASLVIKLVQSRLNRPSNSEKKKRVVTDDADEQPKKHVVKKVLMEIITGYLKWKAIELSYKGVQHIIRKRREKREAERDVMMF